VVEEVGKAVILRAGTTDAKPYLVDIGLTDEREVVNMADSLALGKRLPVDGATAPQKTSETLFSAIAAAMFSQVE